MLQVAIRFPYYSKMAKSLTIQVGAVGGKLGGEISIMLVSWYHFQCKPRSDISVGFTWNSMLIPNSLGWILEHCTGVVISLLSLCWKWCHILSMMSINRTLPPVVIRWSLESPICVQCKSHMSSSIPTCTVSILGDDCSTCGGKASAWESLQKPLHAQKTHAQWWRYLEWHHHVATLHATL